jgi:hypothetical protein
LASISVIKAQKNIQRILFEFDAAFYQAAIRTSTKNASKTHPKVRRNPGAHACQKETNKLSPSTKKRKPKTFKIVLPLIVPHYFSKNRTRG